MNSEMDRGCVENQPQTAHYHRDFRVFDVLFGIERFCGWSSTQPRSVPIILSLRFCARSASLRFSSSHYEAQTRLR
jgi:hypothetical protein